MGSEQQDRASEKDPKRVQRRSIKQEQKKISKEPENGRLEAKPAQWGSPPGAGKRREQAWGESSSQAEVSPRTALKKREDIQQVPLFCWGCYHYEKISSHTKKDE